MTSRSGRCLCGAVTYQISAEPMAARICWCRDCQYLAANGTVNIMVPTDALQVRGNTGEHTSTADSGNRLTRRFCAVCATHLFANSSARPQMTGIRVGTLDDPSSVQPTVNIWTSSAPAWACMNEQLDRFERQPGPPNARPGAPR